MLLLKKSDEASGANQSPGQTAGGDFGQQLSVRDITGVLDSDDAGTKPISCLLSLPTALTTKGKRNVAPVKFAKVFQVRHYKTTLPCTEFVDHKWYHQDRCDRPLKNIKSPVKEETYEQWTKDNFQHRRNNSIYKALSPHRHIKSILKQSIVSTAQGPSPAGCDTTSSQNDRNAVYPFVIPISGTAQTKEGQNVLPSKGRAAFQIIGDSGAAQHCRGLDDIPKDERHKIRKADTPLIFVTANGEVPCNKVIATDIPQLGITRDMYVMKDSPSVISIGRLVIDDGCDFIWKHSDHQAVLISPKGERHNLWNDMYTPMLAVQTSQDTKESKNDMPSPASDVLPPTASVELLSQDTAGDKDDDSRAMTTRHSESLHRHSDSASKTNFLEMF